MSVASCAKANITPLPVYPTTSPSAGDRSMPNVTDVDFLLADTCRLGLPEGQTTLKLYEESKYPQVIRLVNGDGSVNVNVYDAFGYEQMLVGNNSINGFMPDGTLETQGTDPVITLPNPDPNGFLKKIYFFPSSGITLTIGSHPYSEIYQFSATCGF